MKRVKIFHDRSRSDLEECINDWLEEGIYEIIDIRFIVSDWGYSVLVLYKYKVQW